MPWSASTLQPGSGPTLSRESQKHKSHWITETMTQVVPLGGPMAQYRGFLSLGPQAQVAEEGFGGGVAAEEVAD